MQTLSEVRELLCFLLNHSNLAFRFHMIKSINVDSLPDHILQFVCKYVRILNSQFLIKIYD